jgi:AmmeMemoRadiSam system protein A
MLPQPENHPDGSSGLTPPSQPEPGEFSAEERAQLLRVAHQSIESAFQNKSISFEPPSPHLAERRGVFTTLYRQGELRGCVGYVFPIVPLYQAVAETARAAAFDDNRFLPVCYEETPELQASLSVLSLLQRIQPEDVEIGRHGLVVTLGSNRGLLLPQVPVEHHWDRITFLEQSCRKAGLPLDAWRTGATLEAFTAEVFGDEGLH